ncbi:class I SAM-dependent methyltransferase [Thermaerobacillus caldiproteolyticus]|uniref:Ubiquinone/menaquinone biosynthesis C-methylase UbiE n=1 Tax=Thermaerobacillus caldiproteolyticus TaxID=247480 RepID=A0A7W0BYN6_9BACL|nr:class I SAM-dependent methyltransferase [Anoxybacillus caldiproteolyticus]MBA2875901.1 ubiquinone/menaquinone biosynthesis C-methylase UbiE [Anoxybacillus caldiproteolyticus]QPA32454.1 class I SAM-dependent methyltransferase [Anoxybacillus caldiproteolyticus]
MKSFDWHEEAEKQWDKKAGFWHKSSEDMWEHGSRKTIVPFLATYIPKEGEVADFGCGDGYGSWKLYQAGYRVIGVDLSREMIEKAKARGEHERLRFIQGDLTQLPFADETFSGAMAINSLEWTEEPLKALNEMRRVLKRDHYLCVGLLGPTAAPRKNSYLRLYGKPVICNTMMPWEFEQLAQENGWDIIDGQGVYKRGVHEDTIRSLPTELKQALTFMWLFMLRKK